MPWINKTQSDLLEWTDKDDPNDVIIVDEEGNIIKRRPMLVGTEDGSYSVWGELDDKGNWILKTDRE